MSLDQNTQMLSVSYAKAESCGRLRNALQGIFGECAAKKLARLLSISVRTAERYIAGEGMPDERIWREMVRRFGPQFRDFITEPLHRLDPMHLDEETRALRIRFEEHKRNLDAAVNQDRNSHKPSHAMVSQHACWDKSLVGRQVVKPANENGKAGGLNERASLGVLSGKRCNAAD